MNKTDFMEEFQEIKMGLPKDVQEVIAFNKPMYNHGYKRGWWIPRGLDNRNKKPYYAESELNATYSDPHENKFTSLTEALTECIEDVEKEYNEIKSHLNLLKKARKALIKKNEL